MFLKAPMAINEDTLSGIIISAPPKWKKGGSLTGEIINLNDRIGEE